MKRYVFLLFIIVTSLFHGPLQAQNDKPSLDQKFPFPMGYESASEPENNTDQFHARFMKMLYILGLLIVFMIVAAWMIKKLMRNRTEQLNVSGSIKVVESRYLSPKTTIHLLDVDGKGVLIAESHVKVTPLGEIDLEQSKS